MNRQNDASKGDTPTISDNEIVSLNLETLDVEELERRLEMSTGDMVTAAWVCGTNDNHPPQPLPQPQPEPLPDPCPNLA